MANPSPRDGMDDWWAEIDEEVLAWLKRDGETSPAAVGQQLGVSTELETRVCVKPRPLPTSAELRQAGRPGLSGVPRLGQAPAAPALPREVVAQTRARYLEALGRLTGLQSGRKEDGPCR